MREYGWTTYDAKIGGSQTIRDEELGVDLTIDFIKSMAGENWGIGVSGVPRPGRWRSPKIAVMFHIALEQMQVGRLEEETKSLVCETDDAMYGADWVISKCNGADPILGKFDIAILGDRKNKVLHGPAIKSTHVSEDKIWQAKCELSVE